MTSTCPGCQLPPPCGSDRSHRSRSRSPAAPATAATAAAWGGTVDLTIAALGQTALSLGGALEALEVNPLWVNGDQVEALDVLVVTAPAVASEPTS